jgi:hypothetical protein
MSRPATSSGRKTADAAISARPALLKGVTLEGDGTNACSVIIYDNASAASGTVLAKVLLPASGDMYVSWSESDGVEAINGLYADVAGTGAAYIVHYSSQ